MFTINVLSRVLTVWFCLNSFGFSLSENDNVNILVPGGDKNVSLKTSFHSNLTKERGGSKGTRRRSEFMKRITKRLEIFDKLLTSYEKREGLV